MKIDYPESIKPSDLDQFIVVFRQLAKDKIRYIEYNRLGMAITIHFKDGSQCGAAVPWIQAGLMNQEEIGKGIL
jgi:hypothetical protein